TYHNCPGDSYVLKNRYLSFQPPAGPGCGVGTGLRVTFQQMPRAGDCPHIPDFSSFENNVMWVGKEVLAGSTIATGVFELQSTPLYRDWTTVPGGVVQVSDCNIVPCASYKVDAIAEFANTTVEASYSPPLILSTTMTWGDVVGANDV